MSVVAGANVGVMVAHDAPGTSQHHAATPQPPYEFVLGDGVGLGNFLASVIGAEVKVSMDNNVTLTGQVLLVEEAQRTVSGSDNVVESVYSDLQLLSDEGEVVRVAMAEMRSVQVLDPELRRALNEALKNQIKQHRPAPPPSHHTELRITAMHGGGASYDEGTELRVSYAAPTKEWLCSYRLDVPAEGDGASLHHFAQVWNTGDQDWRSVELSLVANDLQLLKQAAAQALTARNVPASRASHCGDVCGGMEIFVKTLTGKAVTLGVEPSDTVEDIKARSAERAPPEGEQTLTNG